MSCFLHTKSAAREEGIYICYSATETESPPSKKNWEINSEHSAVPETGPKRTETRWTQQWTRREHATLCSWEGGRVRLTSSNSCVQLSLCASFTSNRNMQLNGVRVPVEARLCSYPRRPVLLWCLSSLLTDGFWGRFLYEG
jgi:hypothetical protein